MISYTRPALHQRVLYLNKVRRYRNEILRTRAMIDVSGLEGRVRFERMRCVKASVIVQVAGISTTT